MVLRRSEESQVEELIAIPRWGIAMGSFVCKSYFYTMEPSLIDGVARCARYAFGPNKLHLCGPDTNSEVLAYINAGASDEGLGNILQQFKTLFPYLRSIAHANNIKDPFDSRVVEAYWIGNELLDTIPVRVFHRHLKEDLALPKRMPSKQFERLQDKLPQGALMHHSFHVLNIWNRTGHDESEHTLESFDKCRISWGKITAIDGPKLSVSRKPIVLQGGRLALGKEETSSIYRQLEASTLLDNVVVGDAISMHWDRPCEVIDNRQLANLQKYTARSIALANQTI